MSNATPMNINQNHIIPLNMMNVNTIRPSMLGKRKGGKSGYERAPKRTDLSMISEIGRVTHDVVNIRLPRNLINELKRINQLSSARRVEYAGKIDFGLSKNGSNTIKFNNPSRFTSNQRGQIGLEVTTLLMNSYVTYHTHPAPPPGSIVRNNGNMMNLNNNSRKRYVTLPSGMDFEAYIKGYPGMQANIIADAHGYYIIDIVESGVVRRARPSPTAVNRFMEWVRSQPFLRSRYREIEGYEYFETTLGEWKNAINVELHPRLLKHFGISMKYYGYNDIPGGIITIGR